MTRASETESVPKVERGLTALFVAGDPDPAFVMRLEQQLRSQAATQATSLSAETHAHTAWSTLLPRRRWSVAGLAIVLALAATVAVIGPARVLADIQRLFGYAPGIGFTGLDQSLVLQAPVEVAQEGVTLRIEQVVAGPYETQIALDSVGLPPEARTADGTAGDADTYPHILLKLPDGKTLAPKQWALRYGGATLHFPALPPGAREATLEVARLPLISPGKAPENWSLSFTLRPTTDDTARGRITQTYQPAGASDSRNGIAVQVVQAAHSAQQTALRVRVSWQDPRVKVWDAIGGRYLPTLRDDQGASYQYSPASSVGAVAGKVVEAQQPGAASIPTPDPSAVEEEMTFPPLTSGARRLTLVLDGIDVDVPVEGRFTIDLGSDPALGDSWPLDVNLELAGFPVHLSGARLAEEELLLRDGVRKQTILDFDVDPVADQNGRVLRGLKLNAESPSFNGSGGGYNYRTNHIRLSAQVREGAQVPPGPLTFVVTGASVTETGPWQMSWEIPGR